WESQFREIISKAGEGIFITQDGVIKYENQACLDITGYSFGRWSSSDVISGLVHPDDRDMVALYHSLRMEGKESPGKYDFRLVGKDGAIKWIEMNASVCIWEGQPASLALITYITERKNSERALKEREGHFRSLLETIPDALIVYDDMRRVTFANKAFEQLYGRSIDELIGKPLINFVPPSELEITRQSWERTLRGANVVFETQRWTKEGKSLDIQVSTAILRDTEGKHTASIVIHRDITELKHTQAALRQNTEMFRAIVEGDPDAVFVHTDGLFAYLNRRALGLFGAESQEDLLGKPIMDRMHPSLRKTVKERIRLSNIERQPVPAAEEIFLRMDGSTVDVEVSAVPIIFQGRDGSLVFAHDITNRKQADQERLLLTTAIEQSAESIMITDTEGSILYINTAFEQINGYSRQEAIGKRARILIERNEKDTAVYENLRMTLDRGEVWRGRLTNKKKDKTLYEAEVTISPVKDKSGRIINYVGVSRDVTNEALLQKQFIQAQKMEAVGTLAGGIAHDFNNLLQVVLGYSELMLRRKSEKENDYSDLQKIFQAGKRGTELVKSLLMFSRKLEPKYRPINLNQEIIQVQGLLSRTIPKTIKIDLRLSGDLEPIQADQSQIGQILMNLGVNARDAMPDGGALTIETANVELGQEYCNAHLEAKPGRYVLLTVSDTGHGIDRETLSHIFEPFFTTKGVGKGTGLGLATVYGIVKEHDGLIICYSEPGQGTTFKIYFHAIQTDENVETLESETDIPHGTETILLVDDDEVVRDLAATVLDNFGYQVITAGNGKEALDIYMNQSGKIALVILDLIMPEMDGRQCLNELLRIDPKTKVIIASGHSVNGKVEEIFLSRAKAFVEKPYDIRNLLKNVRDVLDKD
ncbi:MAG: PAS domain S-box protein, partial [Syntrophaceae bacterium]|nr:PAS domain S-box protein [Syntrophaceae bacterium]